jgi:hypothetical protein
MNNVITPQQLAQDVLRAYEQQDGMITKVEFHNSSNFRSRHRVGIDGNIDIYLMMHYEWITPAQYRITLQVWDGKWQIKSEGFLDEVNIEYNNDTHKVPTTFMILKSWAELFVDEVLRLKTVEGHGFIAD